MAPPYCFNEFDQKDVGEKNFQPPSGLPGLLKSHKRPLLWPCIGFLLGATFPSYVPGFVMIPLWIALFCSVLIYFRRILRKTAAKATVYSTVFLLVAGGLLIGVARAGAWESKISAAQRLALFHRPQVQGRVPVGNLSARVEIMSNPGSRAGRAVEFTGKIHELTNTGAWSGLPGEPSGCRGLLARVSIYQGQSSPPVEHGEIVVISGKFSVPQGAKNPGEFDYKRHLMSKGIFLELKGTITDRIPRTNSRTFCNLGFQRISLYIENRINNAFAGEERGILKALFLGDRRDLSPLDSVSFRLAGLYRFIAIAGFHVELAARAVERISKKAIKNVHVSRILGILAACFWAGISGWAVGPLRAFLCVLLRHLAFWARRKYDTLAGSAVCGIVIGFWIPYPLLDASFQLSFAGMLSGWISREYVAGFGDRFRVGVVRRSLLQSLLMAVFMLPPLAYHFQDVSVAGFFLGGIWALFATAGALSFLPVLCLPGVLGRALGWFSFFVLHGIRRFSHIVARIPIASFVFPAPGAVESVSYYGIVVLLLEYGMEFSMEKGSKEAGEHLYLLTGNRHKNASQASTRYPGSERARRALLPALSLALFLSVFLRNYSPWPQVIFLSVGQGDCAVFRTGSTVIVVDTGTQDYAGRVLIPYLKRMGIKRIDLCILSHLHLDHAGGLAELCSLFDVKQIMTCPESAAGVVEMICLNQSARSQGRFLGFGAANEITDSIPPITEAKAGEAYQIGGAAINVFYPEKRHGKDSKGSSGVSLSDGGKAAGETAAGFSNDDSLVFTLRVIGFPMYLEFWGDAPGKAVSELVNAWDMEIGPGEEGQLAVKGLCSKVQDVPLGVIPIVKVPHHGSPDSLVFGFYERLSHRAGMAVISVGPNSYGHPSPDVLQSAEENGLKVFRTDLDGAIALRAYRKKVYVRAFLR
jgi:competence protein ComEC